MEAGMEVVPAGQETDSALAEVSDIVKCADEAQVQASSELLLNLRQMVNEPAFSDVVFLCNDGKRVRASRMLLAGRSKVLKSMLMNGMAESSLSEIEMPAISSPVLLAVFEFLYTGTLCDHQPQGWGIACQVIIASRFFLLPNLEMITRKFMHSLTSAVVEDLPKAACMLTEAVAFAALFDKDDANLRELVTILSSKWSDTMYVNCLSADAFDYLLKNSRGNCKDDGKLSFKEYLRFRQVMRWWVYQSDCGSRATEELLSLLAPDEKEALILCRNPDKFENESVTEASTRLTYDFESWRVNKEASWNSVMRLMTNIDFRWIHAALLDQVVEPLGVVSAVEILNSFRFHALRRPMVFQEEVWGWEHGESYCTLDDGQVLQKTRDGIGLAVMTAAMSRSYGIHQWRFIIEQQCFGFAEMGFMYYPSKKPKLDGEGLSDQYNARVLRFNPDEMSVTAQGTCERIEWKVLFPGFYCWTIPVVFSYDASEHNCSLSVDDTDFGICWDNLPSEVYYPAVSLGKTSRGRVRVELESGFDIL